MGQPGFPPTVVFVGRFEKLASRITFDSILTRLIDCIRPPKALCRFFSPLHSTDIPAIVQVEPKPIDLHGSPRLHAWLRSKTSEFDTA